LILKHFAKFKELLPSSLSLFNLHVRLTASHEKSQKSIARGDEIQAKIELFLVLASFVHIYQLSAAILLYALDNFWQHYLGLVSRIYSFHLTCCLQLRFRVQAIHFLQQRIIERARVAITNEAAKFGFCLAQFFWVKEILAAKTKKIIIKWSQVI
jgi:hypothetical protein